MVVTVAMKGLELFSQLYTPSRKSGSLLLVPGHRASGSVTNGLLSGRPWGGCILSCLNPWGNLLSRQSKGTRFLESLRRHLCLHKAL